MPYPVAAIRGHWTSAVAAFVPTGIAGLQLWLDGSDITTLYTDSAKTTPVTSDGDVVGAWADKSGNGNDAVQATTADKPLYKTAIQNGKSIVRFDGADDYLNCGDVFAPGAQISVFALCKFSDVTADHVVIADWDYPNNERSWGFLYDEIGAEDDLNLRTNTNGLVGGQRENLFGGSPGNANFKLYSILFNAGTITAWINGGSSAVTSDPDQPGSLLDGNLILIGAFGNATTRTSYMLGDITEILVYDTALSAENRVSVENYLNKKWGVY